MNKYLLTFLFLVLFPLTTHSQGFVNYSQAEKDSILKIDFINKDYRFLDKEFKIKTAELKEIEVPTNAPVFRENSKYKDSLRAILNYNLNHSYAEHLAYHRILKKWESVGFYIWETPEETKKLAASLKIYHPYLFYEYLISEKSNSRKNKLLNKLEAMLKSSVDSNQSFQTNKELLYFAFKNNPERRKAMNRYFKSKNSNHRH